MQSLFPCLDSEENTTGNPPALIITSTNQQQHQHQLDRHRHHHHHHGHLDYHHQDFSRAVGKRFLNRNPGL